MEHNFSSGDISSDDIDDFEEHHEHEPKIKQRKLEMIAFKLFKNGTYKSALKLC